jgi:hypothetical protein
MAWIPVTLFVLLLGPALGAAAAPPAAPETPPAAAAISPDGIVAAKATPYNPILRRDPFGAPSEDDQKSKGDLIDDIAIKGRVVSHGQSYAVISDSRGIIRKVPVGFHFRDGVLESISETGVTFRQWDDTTSNTKIFRTVVKTFKREEVKR